eukprot:scaffold13640_cov65-Attheya_sp.AAC.5
MLLVRIRQSWEELTYLGPRLATCFSPISDRKVRAAAALDDAAIAVNSERKTGGAWCGVFIDRCPSIMIRSLAYWNTGYRCVNTNFEPFSLFLARESIDYSETARGGQWQPMAAMRRYVCKTH